MSLSLSAAKSTYSYRAIDDTFMSFYKQEALTELATLRSPEHSGPPTWHRDAKVNNGDPRSLPQLRDDDLHSALYSTLHSTCI